MKKMFARMLALAMTCVVLLTGCGQNPSSSVSGSGGNGSGVQSSGDWPKQPVNVICPASAGGGTDLIQDNQRILHTHDRAAFCCQQYHGADRV